MKQNGAVAAYQIIQIPPNPHLGLIQLRQAKGSGTVLWQRKRKRCRREGKKTHTEENMSDGIFIASVNHRFTDRCAARWQRKAKNQSKREFIPRYCFRKLESCDLIRAKSQTFLVTHFSQKPQKPCILKHTQPVTHITVVLAEA